MEEKKNAPEVEAPRRDSGLSKFATCDLVEELRHREGVDDLDILPYTETSFSINGPAIILVVTD